MEDKVVTIIPSEELKKMKLRNLIGYVGTIAAKSTDGKGFFVTLNIPYMGEKDWYIPKESIELITI